jgi:hypothetical protein
MQSHMITFQNQINPLFCIHIAISWQYVMNFIFIQPFVLAFRDVASLRNQKNEYTLQN